MGHRARIVLFGLAIAAVFGAVHALDLDRWADLDRVRAFIESHGTLAPLVFVGVCVAGIVLHLPEIVLLAAGLLLGVVVAAATVARRTLAAAEVDAVSVSSQGPSGS